MPLMVSEFHAPSLIIQQISDADSVASLSKIAREGLTVHNQMTDYGRNLAHNDYAFQCQVDDAVIAVLTCQHRGAWLYIHYLWVSKAYRGQQLGRRLMGAVDKLSSSLGCNDIHLVTMEYQAIEFYKKCGYEEFARLNDYAENYSRVYYKKEVNSK